MSSLFIPRRSRLLIPCLLALLLPAAGPVATTTGTSAPAELTLENGMHVLLFPHPGSGLVASNVFVGAGSTREEDRYAGSSHFLEHVLFNGTARRSQEEIYAAADRIGAYNNATTKQEYTHYMMVAPAERLAEALDIQADMLLHSTLPTEKFEKERGIVLEELSKDMDDPDYRLEQVLDELLYGADGDFARPILGSAETIRGLPRPVVAEYYRRQYVPANMHLVLMGDFDGEEALELVRRAFRVEKGPDPGRAAPDGDPLPGRPLALAAPGRLVTREIEAPKAVIELAAALPEGTPEDDAALALLARIAGGTKSSRLERALDRDPALSHEETSASLLYREGGRLLVLRARLSGGGPPREAATRLLATLHSLAETGGEELSAARTALLAQEVSQIEKLHYYALFQGDRLWHMPEGYTDRYLAALDGARAAAVGEAARRLLEDARIQVVAAGPGVGNETLELSALEPTDELVRELSAGGSAAASVPRGGRPSPLEADQPPAVLRLENGLTVIHAASASTRMFALHLLVENRSLREPEDLTGIADLLHRYFAAAVEKGDGGGPSRLDLIGADLKVADNPWIPYDDYYTTPLYSFVRLECLDSYYGEALELLAGMLRGPHGDAETLEDARREMLSAIERERGRPSGRVRARFRELLYPGHLLSRPVMGDEASLARVTPEVLSSFAPAYLSPDRLVLAVVGDVSREEVLARLRATLGRLPAAGRETLEMPPPPRTERSAREEIEVGGSQSAIRMGRVFDVEPADRWALLVAARIASARMQQDLRETRGLAYSLGISVGYHGDRAVLIASMETRPENLDEAEAGMRSHFAGGELEVTPLEIETAVNRHLARVRMRRITSLGQAFSLSRDLFLNGGIDYADREALGLASVTPADVRHASGRYLTEGPTITVIAR